MAVMRQSITFGGIDSADYGIYIGGEGTFNAPKRAVEMIEIPGRNGALALDKGYWENVTVEYPCFVYEPDLATFTQTLREFRNALKSQTGYQKLTDSIHPDEYRMAVYVDEFEVDPLKYNTLGEFDLVFNCKPQRYLTSGETAVSVSNNGTLTNPTLFDALPLLAVEGYGNISFNGYSISIANETLGAIELWSNQDVEMTTSGTTTVSFDAGLLASSDTFTVEPSLNVYVNAGRLDDFGSATESHTLTGASSRINITPTQVGITEYLGTVQFTKGSASTVSDALRVGLFDQYGYEVGVVNITFSVAYDSNHTMTYSMSSTISGTGYTPTITLSKFKVSTGNGIGNSSVSILGHPTYIDCEIGEAYKVESNSYISLNRYIDLGSDLPKLAAGNNTFRKDNTITSLTVTPRWWRL